MRGARVRAGNGGRGICQCPVVEMSLHLVGSARRGRSAVMLRNVEPGDLAAYVRMRCDPAMMAELGGALPREGMEAKVQRDVAAAASDRAWICMIVPDPADRGTVAGTVTLWSREEYAQVMSEIGWMVLPEFQGKGLAKTAVRALLKRARDAERWGLVHAFPGVTNAASNAICRALGFTLVGQETVDFADRWLRTNHWRIDPSTDLRER